MEVLDVKSTADDVTCDHFASMVDIVTRRPHLVKSRKKLVAGAKIVYLETADAEISAENFVGKVRNEFRFEASKFAPDGEDYSQQEFDFSKSFVLIRRIVYKGSHMKETNECVFWNVVDASKVALHVVPLDETEADDFSHTKLHYCVTFDASLHQVGPSRRFHCVTNCSW